MRALFAQLVRAERHPFSARGAVRAPKARGVYVIYDSRGKPLHVGRTPRARGGLAQRLTNHLRGRSSFVRQYLQGNSSVLRSRGYGFRYLAVRAPRTRALLEA